MKTILELFAEQVHTAPYAVELKNKETGETVMNSFQNEEGKVITFPEKSFKGKIIRKEDGDKVFISNGHPTNRKLPHKFNEGNQVFNKRSTYKPHTFRLGVIVTGEHTFAKDKIPVFAIDCETDAVFEKYKKLLEESGVDTCIFEAVGKPSGGGSILFRTFKGLEPAKGYDDSCSYEGEPTDSELRPKNNLEILCDGHAIDIPTEDNQTKVQWDLNKKPNFAECPENIKKELLEFIEQSKKREKKKKKEKTKRGTRLHDVALKFLGFSDIEKLTIHIRDTLGLGEGDLKQNHRLLTAQGNKTDFHRFFRMITPTIFHKREAYLQKGHIHPNDVMDGEGSEYLKRVSATLGTDISIDKFLYKSCMYAINNAWADPMKVERLESSFIDYMITGKATGDDGKPIWQFDKNWEKYGLIFTCVNNEQYEIFYDSIGHKHYCVPYNGEDFEDFGDDALKVTKRWKCLTGINYTEKDYIVRKANYKVIVDPTKERGANLESNQYNIFDRLPALEIVQDPKIWEKKYKEPKKILNYFESLAPAEKERTFLLKFLKRKLQTFDYSPVIIYLVGCQGTGKDTFTKLMSYFVGSSFAYKINVKRLVGEFNSFMEYPFFLQVDEIANKTKSKAEREEVIGNLKDYSGQETIGINSKYVNRIKNTTHNVTFVISENEASIPIQDGDRRLLYIHSDNVLSEQPFVTELKDGVTEFIEGLQGEINDFAYYLGTQVKDFASLGEYIRPPNTEEKLNLIASKRDIIQEIAFCIKGNHFRRFEDLCLELEIGGYSYKQKDNRIHWRCLYDIYEKELGGRKGRSERQFKSELRKRGIQVTTQYKKTDSADQYITWEGWVQYVTSDPDPHRYDPKYKQPTPSDYNKNEAGPEQVQEYLNRKGLGEEEEESEIPF